MPKIDRMELVSGTLVIAVGAYFFFFSQEYRMGTVARMGPGFIPYWLGAILMCLGGVIVATGLGRVGRLPQFSLRSTGSILGAIVVFALVLPRFGLVPAVFTATYVSMLGNPDVRWPLIVITASAISAICWTIFIGLLGLNISDFRMPN
jgi:hypothetical protein